MCNDSWEHTAHVLLWLTGAVIYCAAHKCIEKVWPRRLFGPRASFSRRRMGSVGRRQSSGVHI